jgi:hypothetical protein
MLRQAVGIGLALAVLTVAIGRTAGSPPPTQTVRVVIEGLSAGPALSGATVVWGGRDAVYSARGGRQHAIWHAPTVEIPPDIPVYQPELPRSVLLRIESIAASPSTTAVIDSATAVERGTCSNGCHIPPGSYTPIFSELLGGPREGPLVRVEGRRTPCGKPQWLARKLDVAGASVIVAETARSCKLDAPLTPSRVVLVERDRGRVTRTILSRSNLGAFDDVALTTRYAAWEVHYRPKSFVTVYDRLERRVAYRARVDPYRSDIDLDMQADGAVVGFSPVAPPAPVRPVCTGAAPLIATLAHPRFRRLGFTGYDIRVRVARGAVAFMRPSGCGTEDAHPQLVVRQLGGATTVVAGGDGKPVPEFDYFDFDGPRVAWATVTTGADGKRSLAIEVARIR